jgi:NADH-quinone oxidoreductase subunit L
VGGLVLAWVLYVRQPELPALFAEDFGQFYALVVDKFRIDELYDAVIVGPLFALADFIAFRFDSGVVDGAVNGLGAVVAGTSSLWRRVQTGNVQHYALSFLLGALALVWYLARS